MTDRAADHDRRREAFLAEARGLEQRANRISLARLGAFLAAVVLLAAGASQGSTPLMAASGASGALFFALVLLHARVLQRAEGAQVRAAVHERHLGRMSGEWTDLPCEVTGPRPYEHPYAADIDLFGPGSLLQRIDVTHTAPGERHLVDWLGAPADAETIGARQLAVRELAPKVELRQELEATAAEAEGKDKLDPSPFVEFTQRRPLSDRLGPLVPVLYALPVGTLALWGLAFANVVPFAAAWGALAVQTLVVVLSSGETSNALDLVAARRGYAEAFQRALVQVERAELEAPLLRDLRERLSLDGQPPSRYFARLDRWAGFAELRHQFPLNIVANLLLLWDLHVLFRLEDWARDVGAGLDDAFEAFGAIEALASLATLLHLDPAATLPEVAPSTAPFEAEAIHHPLLPAEARVPNDVQLQGPGTALLVTGSNMAGKSTLLRAVGLNLALALAGGPVTARRMRAPLVRLRASMRADDSLQRGASYFQAELAKLRLVVDEAESEPPLFFLLDELLRGTNARARHLGARSVLLHLLDRGATGLVATHDVALAALEEERPGQVANVHFTDVMRDGEMIFDYRLRSGVVKTSNALELLRRAGIEVHEEPLSTGSPDR